MIYKCKLCICMLLFFLVFYPTSASMNHQQIKKGSNEMISSCLIESFSENNNYFNKTKIMGRNPGNGPILDQNQSSHSNMSIFFMSSRFYFAQRFQPTVQILTNISLLLSKQGDSSNQASFYVSIRRHLPFEAAVYEIDLNLINDAASWINLDIPFMTIDVNQSYYIICHAMNVSETGFVQWFYGIGNPYTSGDPFFSEDGREWKSYREGNTQLDFCFQTFGYYNVEPTTPIKPDGPKEGRYGEEYDYTTRATDADDNQLFYQWSWGDGSCSDWLGPYESEEVCKASHIWMVKGSYIVKVKVKDEWDFESDWSDLLTVRMKKKKSDSFFPWNEHPLLYNYIANFVQFLEND